MSDDWISSYIAGADRRYQVLQISVSQTIDLSLYEAMLKRLPMNRSAQSALVSPMFNESVRRAHWDVWLSRPHRRKIDYFSPPGRLIGMAGGDETQYWQTFPESKEYDVTDIDERLPTDESSAPWPYFRTWLPPAVAELIYPAFIWEEPEGYRRDPTISVTGSAVTLGRDVIVASLVVTDWDTRNVGWSEIIFPADQYELLVDKQTGILLSVRSESGARDVSRTTVERIAFADPVDPGFFSVRNWIGADWVAAR